MKLPYWFHQYMIAVNMTNLTSVEIQKMFHRAKPHYDFAMDHPHAKFHQTVLHHNHGPLKMTASHNRRHLLNTKTPTSFDWRDFDMVTPVATQGTCNSCYALTACDNLNYWSKKIDGTFSVSGQTLMDCSESLSSGLGCNGGVMDDVFKWHGPYGSDKFYDGKPHICDKPDSGIYVQEYITLSNLEGDEIEPELASAVVQYGPIPVGIDARSSRFITYSSGIIEENECNKEPNHAVTVVGFTPEYWIVKNSWGEHWGQRGYGKISRGHDTCGISSYASFATQVVWRDTIHLGS